MTLEELIPVLQSNHFYPSIVVAQDGKKEKVVELNINSPSLTTQSRLQIIKDVVGEGFLVSKIPNKDLIAITKKK